MLTEGKGANRLTRWKNRIVKQITDPYRVAVSYTHLKFLFGSNYPNQITKCSIDTFQLLKLSENYRRKMFKENAEKLLSLNV